MWQYDKSCSNQIKKRWLKQALETCELALQDPDTHVIFHPYLQKRLLRLERSLNIPKSEQHVFTHVSLRSPVTREFTGIRIDSRDIGKKSVWKSIKDPNLEISVEQLCLEHYQNQGWKGFHSENGIISTIVLLFNSNLVNVSLPCYFGISCFYLSLEFSRLLFRRRL
jgi:fanconi-associated nuclease 1